MSLAFGLFAREQLDRLQVAADAGDGDRWIAAMIWRLPPRSVTVPVGPT